MKKIPDNAKKVFEGVFFSVWQWEQQLYDGSFKTFEYVERPGGSTIIPVTKEGKIIIIEEEQPTEEKFFAFPGGSMEVGETPLECASRELLEETGYNAKSIKLWFSLPAEDRVVSNFNIFIAQDCELTKQNYIDPGERIIVHLLTLDELLEKIEDKEFKCHAILPHLLKAKYKEEGKQKLKELLGIMTS